MNTYKYIYTHPAYLKRWQRRAVSVNEWTSTANKEIHLMATMNCWRQIHKERKREKTKENRDQVNCLSIVWYTRRWFRLLWLKFWQQNKNDISFHIMWSSKYIIHRCVSAVVTPTTTTTKQNTSIIRLRSNTVK